MSGILDLAQMKWCHIRSIESVQEVEKSNIGFKRIVLDMKSRSAQQEESIGNLIKVYSSDLKEEVAKIRDVYTQDIEFVNQSHELLKEAMIKLITITSDQQQSMNAITDENNSLTESMLNLKKSQRDIDNQYLKDIEKSRSKTIKHKELLAISEASRTTLAKENRQLREEINAESMKTEILNAEHVKLKHKCARIESDCTEAVAVAKKRELHNRLEHNEILKSAQIEILRLQQHILELQLENERLSNAAVEPVPDSNNNFAKFVQLKTENVALKSQLNVVVARRNTAPLAGLSSTSSGSVDNLPLSTAIHASLDYNSKKEIMAIMGEKKKIDRHNDQEIPHHRSVAEKLSEKHIEKNEGKHIVREGPLSWERSNSFLDSNPGNGDSFYKLSVHGNAPPKIPKRFENNSILQAKLRNVNQENLIKTTSNKESEDDSTPNANQDGARSASPYDISETGNINDEKDTLIDKNLKKTKKKISLSLLSMTSNNINTTISNLNKVGDVSGPSCRKASLIRSASLPIESFLLKPDEKDVKNLNDKNKIDKCVISGIALNKSNNDNECESKTSPIHSIDSVKRIDSCPSIGVQLISGQTRSALKERLLT